MQDEAATNPEPAKGEEGDGQAEGNPSNWSVPVSNPGAHAGIEPQELSQRPTVKGSVLVSCIDYGPDQSQIQEIADLAEFLAGHRPEWVAVRWISVRGLKDMAVIRAIAEKYELHPLAIEDVLTQQRPKAEDYPGIDGGPSRLFVVARVMRRVNRRLVSKQVSFFLGRNTLVTFQDSRQGLFESIRRLVETRGSRIRGNDVSFLLYSMLDAVVDNFFPILEEFGERIEELDQHVMGQPNRATLNKIHRIKMDLLAVRRVAWPMRELILELRHECHERLSANTRTYFRDLYDHVLVIFDLIQSYHEFAANLTETYMSVVSNRMNDIMKTLTIISTIFVPLTFLAGVYGMNMKIPENEYWESYPIFWVVCLTVIGSMLFWFKRRGWF